MKHEEAMTKKYVLDMFPYPSGVGLHVGHMLGYVATDVISRYLRMKGYEVLHPMGWDAFGLPAENYAIKTGIHPDKSTHANIDNFRSQLKLLDLSYDWSRELDTSDPSYYKWTQWLFILLFKRGLAYKKKAAANWCPSCETVLANEQVVDGVCERCGTMVVQKDLEQWFFKITDYADRLIAGLDRIDWLNEVKVQQKNWIGRKVGVRIKFGEVEVFTTKPETIMGATFVVVAPEHEFAKKSARTNPEVKKYLSQVEKETNFTRETKTMKTGVFGGAYVTHPVSGEKLPVWIADYVLIGAGTGAIMGVPESDERDMAFAKMFNLSIKKYVEYKQPLGEKMVTYHLRDWLVSRQRYWGAPIPMIYCEKCAKDGRSWFTENNSPLHPPLKSKSDDFALRVRGGPEGVIPELNGWYPVSDEDLPVLLPRDVDFKPTGESPIALSKSFPKDVVCPICGGEAKREVDTMDTYVDSSWYFVRFVDPNNDKEIASKEMIKKWLPVDNYVGGGHVVQHLLFARFFYKVMCDAGLINCGGDEPFLKLRAPGWILGPDSRKMSKRWGNIITPEDVVAKFGADALRMYELFMGPFEATKPWNTAGVEGIHRFLGRLERLFAKIPPTPDGAGLRQIDKLVMKVGQDIEAMSFNTAIATMMETLNLMSKSETIGFEVWEKFVLVLAPFVPNLAEKMWDKMGKSESVHKQSWPEYDEDKTRSEKVMIAIEVNGKTRGIVEEEEGIEEKVTKMEKIKKYIEGKKYRVIHVPGRVVNFVVDD